jgi:hypothetical protein
MRLEIDRTASTRRRKSSYYRSKKASPIGKAFLLVFVVEDYQFDKRETRFERATSTLARLRSTTELHPRIRLFLQPLLVLQVREDLSTIFGSGEDGKCGESYMLTSCTNT